MVERHLAMVKVAGSSLVVRFVDITFTHSLKEMTNMINLTIYNCNREHKQYRWQLVLEANSFNGDM